MAQLAIAAMIASGLATRYDPGVMDQVVENRVDWGQVDPSLLALGYVALLDCERIGEPVWLEHPDGRVVGPVVVADCAQEEHREELIGRGFAVDLSYELAVELGAVEAPVMGMKVWDGRPRTRQPRRGQPRGLTLQD